MSTTVEPASPVGLFTFQGRMGRLAFNLISWPLSILLMVMDGLLEGSRISSATLLILIVGYILICWILLVTQVKRWHDRDKSGWWCFIGVIPLVGPIWSLVELCFLRGTEGPNDFGNDQT